MDLQDPKSASVSALTKQKIPAEGEHENEEKKKREERGERKTKGPLGPRENAEDGT